MIDLLEKLQKIEEEDFEDIFQPISDEEIDARGLRPQLAVQQLKRELESEFNYSSTIATKGGHFSVYNMNYDIGPDAEAVLEEVMRFVKKFFKKNDIEIQEASPEQRRQGYMAADYTLKMPE